MELGIQKMQISTRSSFSFFTSAEGSKVWNSFWDYILIELKLNSRRRLIANLDVHVDARIWRCW